MLQRETPNQCLLWAMVLTFFRQSCYAGSKFSPLPAARKGKKKKSEEGDTKEENSDDNQGNSLFACPICNEVRTTLTLHAEVPMMTIHCLDYQENITEDQLYTHTMEKHADVGNVRYVCPICASRPGADPPRNAQYSDLSCINTPSWPSQVVIRDTNRVTMWGILICAISLATCATAKVSETASFL